MTSRPEAKPNVIDRAVNFFSPGAGLRRMRDRQLSALIGGYESASTSSAIFQEFITQTLSFDSSFTSWDRKKIVDRCRWNVRNVPVATAVIKRICDHAIGDQGLTLHPQIDRKVLNLDEQQAKEVESKISDVWRWWSESKEVDYNGELNFPEMTYLTLQEKLEGGDCFNLLLNDKEGDFSLNIQSIESEYVSNENGKTDTRSLTDGIEKAGTRPKAVWISEYHPGDRKNTTTNKWNRREIYATSGRRVILHQKNMIRFGQTRGVPVLGPVTGKLLQLGKLSDAELLAAVLNSYFAIIAIGKPDDTQFTKKSPNATETLSDDEKIQIGHGTIARVKPGTTIQSFDPKRPNALFLPFFLAIVGEIGAAIGVPKSIILMSFDKSYSASRGEVLLAWLYFMSQRTSMAVNFCQPVYETFLDEAVLRGYIDLPGYFSSSAIKKAYHGSPYNQWTGPTRPAIDEYAEAQAYQLYHDMEVQSLTEITAKTTGKQWDKVIEQINSEKEKSTAKQIVNNTMASMNPEVVEVATNGTEDYQVINDEDN